MPIDAVSVLCAQLTACARSVCDS